MVRGAEGGNSPAGRTQARDPTAKPKVGQGLLGKGVSSAFPPANRQQNTTHARFVMFRTRFVQADITPATFTYAHLIVLRKTETKVWPMNMKPWHLWTRYGPLMALSFVCQLSYCVSSKLLPPLFLLRTCDYLCVCLYIFYTISSSFGAMASV